MQIEQFLNTMFVAQGGAGEKMRSKYTKKDAKQVSKKASPKKTSKKASPKKAKIQKGNGFLDDLAKNPALQKFAKNVSHDLVNVAQKEVAKKTGIKVDTKNVHTLIKDI